MIIGNTVKNSVWKSIDNLVSYSAENSVRRLISDKFWWLLWDLIHELIDDSILTSTWMTVNFSTKTKLSK